MKSNLFKLIALSFLLAASSANLSLAQETATDHATNQAAEPHATKPGGHFDYQHQGNWHFAAGDHQSPINIISADLQPMQDKGLMELHYKNIASADVDNGHSVQVTIGGAAEINGRKFDLQQFHFHAPSEHTVDGQFYPLELHLVNKGQNGSLAVIGVFFKEGAANPGFQQVLDNISDGVEEKEIVIDVQSMIPANKSYYHYLGSLTTPPLRENVEWYVLANPVEVSKEQIETFHKGYNGNNRQVQKLEGRLVIEHKE